MRSLFASSVVLICLFAASTAYALVTVSETGDWDNSWPQKLQSLRKQARTFDGPFAGNQYFAIRFNDREQFEAAWPHLLKVKAEGAPIYLKRGQNSMLGEKVLAGVIVHNPTPNRSVNRVSSEDAAKGIDSFDLRWKDSVTIQLVVDGDIVDLNRIELPKNTPIVDQRFEKKDK